jgi:hypothetical protein
MSTGKYFLHIQSIQQYLEISQHREKIGQHRQRLTLGFHWNIMDRWVETKNQTFKFTIQCFNYERKWWRLFRKGVVYKLDIYFGKYFLHIQSVQQYLEIIQHREKIGQHGQRLTLGFHWNIMDRWVETKNQTFKFTIQCFNYERNYGEGCFGDASCIN